MRNLKRGLILLCTAACISGCSANQPARMSHPHLIPQPEGTPLPPRDPRIAQNWSPQIKQLVDNMLALFDRAPDGRTPSVKDVEQKLGITLTEVKLQPGEMRTHLKRFEVSATTPYSSSEQRSLGRYIVLRGEPPVRPYRQSLQLLISPDQSYCLDPYELAVYTGSSFINGDVSTHGNVRAWKPAYVWGMFTWSAAGKYVGQGFSIELDQQRDPSSHLIKSAGCVHSIRVSGEFQPEKE